MILKTDLIKPNITSLNRTNWTSHYVWGAFWWYIRFFGFNSVLLPAWGINYSFPWYTLSIMKVQLAIYIRLYWVKKQCIGVNEVPLHKLFIRKLCMIQYWGLLIKQAFGTKAIAIAKNFGRIEVWQYTKSQYGILWYVA